MNTFKNKLIDAGILDPVKMHHEFVSGMHGQKLDFDKIKTGSRLYKEWAEQNAEEIKNRFRMPPEVILGVANGTNRLALDVARRFDGRTIGLTTERGRNPKTIKLTKLARRVIGAVQPELVLVLEDVGTTGKSSVQPAREALETGAKNVEVIISWQRQPDLLELDKEGIPYHSLINYPLATYTPKECQQSGFCSKGWDLIG